MAARIIVRRSVLAPLRDIDLDLVVEDGVKKRTKQKKRDISEMKYFTKMDSVWL